MEPQEQVELVNVSPAVDDPEDPKFSVCELLPTEEEKRSLTNEHPASIDELLQQVSASGL